MKLTVLERIEELRLQMQKIALDKDLTDARVLGVSEKLDALINQFYMARKGKVCSEDMKKRA